MPWQGEPYRACPCQCSSGLRLRAHEFRGRGVPAPNCGAIMPPHACTCLSHCDMHVYSAFPSNGLYCQSRGGTLHAWHVASQVLKPQVSLCLQVCAALPEVHLVLARASLFTYMFTRTHK